MWALCLAALVLSASLFTAIFRETPDHVANEYFTLRVVPTFLTTDLNDIMTTFNSVGNIAFNGTRRSEGDGFNYQGNENILFHGGLMIGTDANHLSDVVRTGGLFSDPADGFHLSQPYRLATLPDSSLQTGMARFENMPEVLNGPFDISQIGLVCVLGYADFRFADCGWRKAYPKLDTFHQKMLERPSVKISVPPAA